jgi:Pro-kumamolisin, activation domain
MTILSRTAADPDQTLLISIYVRRDVHDNGMSLQEYAHAVMDGTHPILDHAEWQYQFGAVAEELYLVVQWATDNGLNVIESRSDTATVKVTGTISQLNALFTVDLMLVTTEDRSYITHDGEAVIPSDIAAVVELVLGLDNRFTLSNCVHVVEPVVAAPALQIPYPTQLQLISL